MSFRSEILALRWLDCDLRRPGLILPQTKNNAGRILPLNDSAMAVLRSLPFTAETAATERELGFRAKVGLREGLAELLA